jgi:hypothetical protein
VGDGKTPRYRLVRDDESKEGDNVAGATSRPLIFRLLPAPHRTCTTAPRPRHLSPTPQLPCLCRVKSCQCHVSVMSMPYHTHFGRTPTYGSRCLSGPSARWAKTSARPERQNVRVWTGIRVPEGAKRPRSCGKASKLGIAGRYVHSRPSSDVLLARSAPEQGSSELPTTRSATCSTGLTSARPSR